MRSLQPASPPPVPEVLVDVEVLDEVEVLVELVVLVVLLVVEPPPPPIPPPPPVVVVVVVVPPSGVTLVPMQEGLVLPGEQQTLFLVQTRPGSQSSLLLSVSQSCPSPWAEQPAARRTSANGSAKARATRRLFFTRDALAESSPRAYGLRRR